MDEELKMSLEWGGGTSGCIITYFIFNILYIDNDLEEVKY